MISHVIVCWTDPSIPDAAERLIAGAEQFLRPIPGMVFFHAGKCVPNEHPVVDSTFQVTLNMVLESREAYQRYAEHPDHLRFAEEVFLKLVTRTIMYDFE